MVNIVFTVALLGVFAMAALLVAVMGARVYSSSADRMSANYQVRTSLVYMAEKVRQCPGEISVRSVGENDALVLSEEIDEVTYESWIYASDGYLYEIVIQSGSKINPGEGQQIMELASMSASQTRGTLDIEITNMEGKTESLTLSRI
jgi:hypothetical protein